MVGQHFFNIREEYIDENSYWIEYESDIFILRIEKYRNEFQPTLRKKDYPDLEINMFNLLKFLNPDDVQSVSSNFFHDVKDMSERYCMQLGHIYDILDNNLDKISEFFSHDNYELKFSQVEEFVIRANPGLFKKE